MNPTVNKFLNNAFSEIINRFPDLIIEYKYSDLTQNHVVKVTPAQVYNSEEFMDLEGDLNKLWLLIDTEDDFGIVTSDSVVDTSNMEVIYTPEPQEYQISVTFETKSISIVETVSEGVFIQENQTFEVSHKRPAIKNTNDHQFGMAA